MNTGEIINLFCQTEESECNDCKPCRRCQFELKAPDKYCRRCGWRQFDFVTGNLARVSRQLPTAQPHNPLSVFS